MDNIKFELNERESAAARSFITNHYKICRKKDCYQGAISVGWKYSFSETSIGVMISVKCGWCGELELVSEN